MKTEYTEESYYELRDSDGCLLGHYGTREQARNSKHYHESAEPEFRFSIERITRRVMTTTERVY